jgi:hypothetical protein
MSFTTPCTRPDSAQMRLLSVFVMPLLLMGVLAASARAAEQGTDQWAPLRRFIGDWTGTASGQAGTGTVTRSYVFVMNGRFIHETNTSAYPPQEKNKAGEVHEHWGVFSYDKAQKVIVIRQFHVESFVVTYRQAATPEAGTSLVFDSEAFENFSNSWKARESYEFVSDEVFIETFELARPGQRYKVYSRTHLKRVA